MEFGIGMFGDSGYDYETKKYRSPDIRLKEIIEEVKLADEVGIDVFAMGEHHRDDYVVSSPETMLAALSTVTKNIILSSGVNVLSSTDPVKLYQDFAMIDLISEERTEIMAGRGSFIESFPLFGQSLQDYNELFSEKLDLLLQLRKNEPITWEGKFRPALKNQIIYPQPKREIPVWIAVGGTPQSVYRAAALGLPVMFAIIGGDIRQFKQLFDYYKEVYIKAGHDIEKMETGVHSHTYVAPTKEIAIADYYPEYSRHMNKIAIERNWGGSPFTQSRFEAGMTKQGALFMGNPDEVAEKIIYAIELFGLTRFIAHIDVGGPSHKELMRTIELYGTKVVPIVKKYFNEK
ncbi:MAG: LLM class flavin-dependent oxidoreductase [Bacteroidia bacterium]|nr:LLM class flavin-dependent oxidoreductase [Bacteroidia bacterium]MCZ2248298.1 LLM class flavin-dependent oxidoreductase [Bacteroidia bacterium]